MDHSESSRVCPEPGFVEIGDLLGPLIVRGAGEPAPPPTGRGGTDRTAGTRGAVPKGQGAAARPPCDAAVLRRCAPEALPGHCARLRDFLVQSIARSGGHFAANLGVVELTVALHHLLDTAHDRLIWDVGHQAYAHKALTGRAGRLDTIRKRGGLSGFPRRTESVHDAFGTAHSSTSVSAGLGMAVAARLTGLSRRHVVVIGDGALTAGQAYEALGNAADSDADLLIIVNDNQMSISEAVGALPRHLQALVGSQAAGAVTAASLFECLGLPYRGPVDGHDVDALVRAIGAELREPGVRVLHVRTRKGAGYAPAERDPIAYHGPGPFDPAVGVGSKESGALSYTAVFGRWLCAMAERDERVVAITPAMREGSGLVEFARRFPDRYFDVGIAEQHALTFAAGLACDGLRPVVAIYSTFLQRAYDQWIHDIVLQGLPVMLAIDRAGLVGADGATHAGAFDLACLRALPGVCLMTPSDENECWRMLTTGLRHMGPSAVRYPRGTGPGAALAEDPQPLPIGRARVLRRGRTLALLAFGSMTAPARTVAERLDATLVDMRFVKPLDLRLLRALAGGHELFVTLEEGVRQGGAGGAVREALETLPDAPRVLGLGLPDRIVGHGSCAELLSECGLDSPGIERSIRRAARDLKIALPAACRD